MHRQLGAEKRPVTATESLSDGLNTNVTGAASVHKMHKSAQSPSGWRGFRAEVLFK